jgi:hypothetical protein
MVNDDIYEDCAADLTNQDKFDQLIEKKKERRVGESLLEFLER